MPTDEFKNPVTFSGHVAFQSTVTLPDSTVTNAKVSSSALNADRMRDVRRCVSTELFGPAVSVAALTQWLHIVRGSIGTIVGFEAAIAVVASDVSRTVTVDLQKSTGGAAFATVCSGTIGFTNASSVRVPVAATFSSTSLVDGDILQVVVTVAGGSGTQATGLTVTLTFDEYNV